MNADDELAETISERLCSLVDGLVPSRDLIERVDSIPSRAAPGWRRALQRVFRRPALVVPLPVGAVVAAAVLLLGSAPAAASYVITLEPNGSVVVTINQVTGVAAANASLNRLNVHSIVIVRMRQDCVAHPDLSYMGVASRPAPQITLVPVHLPPRTTIILAARQIGPRKVEMAVGRIKGPVPSCVSTDGTGPGLGSGSATRPHS